MFVELLHIYYFFFVDRHHFDNPVYSGIAPRPGTSIGGGLPLNNGCSRVVNHFAPSTSSKKHVNIERDKLGVAGSNPAAAANHYQGEDTEEDEHERGNYTYNCFHYSFCDSLNFRARFRYPFFQNVFSFINFLIKILYCMKATVFESLTEYLLQRNWRTFYYIFENDKIAKILCV